jgi:hypothetical protein
MWGDATFTEECGVGDIAVTACDTATCPKVAEVLPIKLKLFDVYMKRETRKANKTL